MNGYITDYVPGTDHAVIENKVFYLKRLWLKNNFGKLKKKLDMIMEENNFQKKFGIGKKGIILKQLW